MALQLDKEQPTGVVVSYWKIHGINLNLNTSTIYIEQNPPYSDTPMLMINGGINEGQIEVVLYGYVSKAKCNNGKLPVVAESFTFDVPETLNRLNDIRDIVYEYIKLEEGWETAIDV